MSDRDGSIDPVERGLGDATPVRPPRIDTGDDVSDAVRRELSDAFSSPSDDEAVIAVAGMSSRRTVVVIDADDDLPDAAVLEDDRGRRVVIDERDAAAPRATAPDPRLRARRIAVRRAEGRRRLRVALVIAGLLVIVIAILAVAASPLVAVDTVDVEGAVYADPEVVKSVVDDMLGEPILLVDLAAAERRLEEIPWVSAARVTRDLPGRVLVEILERRPLAHFRGADGRYRVIDVEARVIDVIDGFPIDYVEITGRGPDLEPGDDAGPAYRGAAQLANALPPSLRPRVRSMAVTEAGEITLVVDGAPLGATTPPVEAPPITVVFGRPDDYQDKLVAVVNELGRHQPGEISTIDVSTGSPIVSR